MVQKYQSPVRVYKHPFELIMAAYERRFPTCKLIPVFVGSEVSDEYRSEDGAVHVIERRCKLNVDAPYLLKKIVGVDYVYFIQKNSLDLRGRTLKIEAHNESFSSRIVINEVCTYSVHPENPEWTCFEQSASLDVKSFFGFESTVEKLAMKQYSQNISKGKEIIEHYVQELLSEGVTYIPPFEAAKEPKRRPSLEGSTESQQKELDLGASASNLGRPPKTKTKIKVEKRLSREDSKLEADYIQRCLGQLTPFQESRLVQLKKWVAELQKGKIPSDATLLRFLRARDFNLEKAREMLSQALIWRKQHQVDKILSEYEPPQVVKDYFPGGWHHQDKGEEREGRGRGGAGRGGAGRGGAGRGLLSCLGGLENGRPMYLLRLGQMDVKGLVKSIGEEGLFKLVGFRAPSSVGRVRGVGLTGSVLQVLHICEEGLWKTEEATRALGKPIGTWTLLVDLDGLNMRHLWRPGVRALLRIIEVVEANYPETMGRVLIVRAPRVFPVLWTLISTFIDDNTRLKFLFYSGNDYLSSGGLVDYMDKDYIPDFLGGDCRVEVGEGGLVPKSLYMAEEEIEKNNFTLCDDTIYHCVSLTKGQVHEVVIHNEDVGSVICWDFDVMKQDVQFSVIHTKTSVIPRDPPQSPTGPLQTIQSMNPLAPDTEHRSSLEKSWKEGADYVKVEPSFVCHDGESIQGSHVTHHKGSYILQWKFYESPPPHSFHTVADFIDSITTHKAKVMYYYETLKSADYKVLASSQGFHVELAVDTERVLAAEPEFEHSLWSGKFPTVQVTSGRPGIFGQSISAIQMNKHYDTGSDSPSSAPN
ncbi:unnamed protein product [Darwinula stevensoni]|uniref:Uncharacterized protein n=1 Tax=Darwinula stevensoni TaxID=69355 RepID=A0A7R9A3N8_9CRUS|nr:unnamed protein product [Darwinula stevensoni]CAG0891982.1 unnamed protein product [Darwinula stevensoni]